MWGAYLGRSLSLLDVAMMMALVKVARAAEGNEPDNPDDIVGYMIGHDTIINPGDYDYEN